MIPILITSGTKKENGQDDPLCPLLPTTISLLNSVLLNNKSLIQKTKGSMSRWFIKSAILNSRECIIMNPEKLIREL